MLSSPITFHEYWPFIKCFNRIVSCFWKSSTCFFFRFRLAKHLFLVIMNDLILLSDLQYLGLIRAGEGWKLTPQSGILTKRSMTSILSRKELNTSLLESCYSKAHSRKFFWKHIQFFNVFGSLQKWHHVRLPVILFFFWT